MSRSKAVFRHSFLGTLALMLVWVGAAFAQEATTLWQFDTKG